MFKYCNWKKAVKKISPYFILLMLTILVLQLTFNFMNVDLSVPRDLYRDFILSYTFTKGVFYNNWVLFAIPQFNLLGAPQICNMADFPVFDSNLVYAFLKLFSLISPDYITALHVYYLFTYVLCAFASFYVLKKFRINNFIAVCVSLLFAFTPFHILRGIEHLTYSSCYLIPLMVLVTMWSWSKKPIFYKYKDKKWQFDFCSKKAVITLITTILSGISCLYFEYFFMFFILIAMISAYFYRKNIYNVFSSVIIISAGLITTVLNAMPYLIYRMQYGVNAAAMIRHTFEAEYYGLKIMQMIMPVDNHYFFTAWKTYYNSSRLLINENSSATLGIVGACGFVFLLFYFLFIRENKFNIYKKLGFLTISALLLATVGSFSSFISFAFFSEIRCYNRISIFIAFFILLAVAFILQQVLLHCNNKKICLIGVALLTIFGLRDAIPLDTSWLMTYQGDKAYWERTTQFIKKIENMNTDKAMIFQLPYTAFPEPILRSQLQEYEQLKPYLISDKLRWSYGAMKGSQADKWYKKTSQLNAEKMIKELRQKGFSGILINVKGYQPKNLYRLRTELDKHLNTYTFLNEEYIYYSLK